MVGETGTWDPGALPEGFFAGVFGGLADAVIITDLDGCVRYWNPAAEQLYGYPAAQALGRFVGDLIVPPAERAQATERAATPADMPYAGDWEVQDRAGRIFTVHVTSTVMLDAGRPTGTLGVFYDVSARRRAECDARQLAAIVEGSADAIIQTDVDGIRAALMASEHRFRARFEQTQVPQAMLALDGALVAVNDALCQLLGRDRAELVGVEVQQLRHPRDVQPGPDPLAAVLAGTVDADTWELTLTGPEGAAIPAMINVALLREADSTPYGVGVFIQDLSELRRAERALTRREALFEALERQANDWTMVIDANAVLLYVSPVVHSALGYVPESVIGRSGWDFVHPDNLPEVQRSVGRVAGSPGASETIVFRGPDVTGAWRWVENVFTNCLDDPDIAGIVCTGRDVTARVEAQEELRRLALRDELTGLANRTLLRDRIDHALARSARAGNGPVAVIFADLDQFKLINDSWGHAAGDRLLVQVARRLTDAVREADTVARFGGDEFVIVCEGTNQQASQRVAERLQEALADPFDLDGRRAYIRASMGIAVSPPHSAPDLLRFADAAMYAAKSRGPGRVQLFDMTLADDAADRLTLGNDLRDALARDELVLHYQPVVELATGALVGLEALARWSHAIRGPVPPQRFVEVAETGGFASTLNRWALHRAGRDAVLLRSLMPVLPRIAVNISVQHLMDADLEADILSAVSGDELDPHELVLEITESALMDNPDQTCRLLERLRASGIKTAIDDFGTGYSSLGHLNQLPVATLKIDRSFIRNITVDADSLAITASVIELARSMGLDTIAEGVETIEQLTLLQSLGCWAAQGFLWSPALSPEALAHLVNGLPDGCFAVRLAETSS